MRVPEPGTGMIAEDITKGKTIDGRRVSAMTRGLRSGQPIVTVRFDVIDRKGRKRLSEPVTYQLGTGIRIPGTRTPTTPNFPAGPVGRKPGGELHGGWWGSDGDSGVDRTARHSRMIDSLTYA
jgi:hypothetical protein